MTATMCEGEGRPDPACAEKGQVLFRPKPPKRWKVWCLSGMSTTTYEAIDLVVPGGATWKDPETGLRRVSFGACVAEEKRGQN